MSGASGFIAPLFDNFFSGYIAVCSGALLVAGAIMLLLRLRLWMVGYRGEGEIVGHKLRMKQHRGEKAAYMPIVRFHADGVQHEFQSRTSGSPSRWPVGARVQIVYLANRPSQAEIAESFRLWIAPLSLILFGLALLPVAMKVAS
jgi:hypothetical protein